MRITREIAIVIERVVLIAMLGVGAYLMFSEVYGGTSTAITTLATSLGG